MSDSPAFQRIDRSIPLQTANLRSLWVSIPILILPSLVFGLVWGIVSLLSGIDVVFGRLVVFLLGFFLLIVVHEMLHGLTWQLLSKAGRGSVEYGVKWKALTPYAHLRQPIGLSAYRWGAAMPGLVLGVLPMLAGLAVGNGTIFVIGIFMLTAASGDILILWMLRKDPGDLLVEDHPENAGCFLLMEG